MESQQCLRGGGGGGGGLTNVPCVLIPRVVCVQLAGVIEEVVQFQTPSYSFSPDGAVSLSWIDVAT